MQLNESAECDNKLFWSLVKRRKGKKQLTCNQLITESGITRDPSQISEGFTNYYTQLYSPLNEDHFDNEFKLHIENEDLTTRQLKSVVTQRAQHRSNTDSEHH